MSDIVLYDEERRSYDRQIKDALEQALSIQGTALNDLESAINCIMQMERGMKMCGVPNTHEATAQYLKTKYKMACDDAAKRNAEVRKLLEQGNRLAEGNSEPLELVEGEIVDDS